MSSVVAILTLEERGQRIPLARTRQRRAVRAVAAAALADVRATAEAESDALLSALLTQEADRIERGLDLLGLTQASGEDSHA